jgi:sec-independent protein translocase protein TatA
MSSLFLIGMPGGMEIVIIVMVVLLFFGGKKIPELMKGIGQGVREFNRARATVETELREGMKEPEKKKIEEERKLEN